MSLSVNIGASLGFPLLGVFAPLCWRAPSSPDLQLGFPSSKGPSGFWRDVCSIWSHVKWPTGGVAFQLVQAQRHQLLLPGNFLQLLLPSPVCPRPLLFSFVFVVFGLLSSLPFLISKQTEAELGRFVNECGVRKKWLGLARHPIQLVGRNPSTGTNPPNRGFSSLLHFLLEELVLCLGVDGSSERVAGVSHSFSTRHNHMFVSVSILCRHPLPKTTHPHATPHRLFD